MRKPFVRSAGRGSRLFVGLLLGQTAYYRQHEALAIEGADKDDDQDDEEGEIDKLPERQGEEEDCWEQILHDTDQNVNHRPSNKEEDRLPGMEANIRAVLEGRDDQEDDCRNDGDVGNAGGGVVGEAGRIRIGHGGSLGAWLLDSDRQLVNPLERQWNCHPFRENRAGHNCSSNCESLLRTFPTRLLTGQACIFSAGKGRSKSTGGFAGSPGASQRA